MKFICIQENLNQGLNIVSQIAYKNTTLPILNNVLIETTNGIITLSTTNLEIAITCIVRGKIEKESKITVNAKLLSEYVNLLPKDKIDIETNDNILNIKCQNFYTKINGQSADDFPIIPSIKKQNVFSCNANNFKKSLQQVIFAASQDSNKHEINGILFNIENNILTLVATDSFRLSEKKITLKQHTKENIKIIVPVYTVQQLLRIINDLENDDIEFFITDNQIQFNYNNVKLISRLIIGEYPNYKEIIPSDYKTTFVLNKQEFIQVIKNVSLFCRLGINDIHFHFNPSNNEILIKAANSEYGENTGKIISEGSGKENNIIFNYKYILDGINNLEGDTVQIQTIDSTSPCLITNPQDNTFRYILMPIRQ